MKDFFIADASRFENVAVTSYFLLSSLSARDKKGGGQYLALTLADKTGSFDARMWEDFADVLRTCSAGCYVKAHGRIDRYNGRFQITLQKLRHAAESEIDLSDFQATTQYNVDELWAELNGFVDRFTNFDLQRLVRSFLADEELAAAFRSAPAAKMLHHAWIGGLLEHVVFLLRLCDRVAPQYPDEIDPDLLMTAAILHDIGKVRELAWKSSFKYTTEGQLLGHITIALGMVREKVATLEPFPDRLRILVEHMILSHHGKYEFGSPKLPMTPEALVFSTLDDLEAKMQNMRAEFAKAIEGGKAADEVTEFSRSMDRALLNSRAYLSGEPARQVPVSRESFPSAESPCGSALHRTDPKNLLASVEGISGGAEEMAIETSDAAAGDTEALEIEKSTSREVTSQELDSPIRPAVDSKPAEAEITKEPGLFSTLFGER